MDSGILNLLLPIAVVEGDSGALLRGVRTAMYDVALRPGEKTLQAVTATRRVPRHRLRFTALPTHEGAPSDGKIGKVLLRADPRKKIDRHLERYGTLVEGLDILSKSKTITTPGGWLYTYIKNEAKHD